MPKQCQYEPVNYRPDPDFWMVNPEPYPGVPYLPLPLNRFPATHVYFLWDGETIKIGRSGAPFARMQELQKTRRLRLQMIGHFRAHPDEELRLHRIFKDLRLGGEWFKPAAQLLDLIAELRDDKVFDYYKDVPELKITRMKIMPATNEEISKVCRELRAFEKKQADDGLRGIIGRLRSNLEIVAKSGARPGFGLVLAEQVGALAQIVSQSPDQERLMAARRE